MTTLHYTFNGDYLDYVSGTYSDREFEFDYEVEDKLIAKALIKYLDLNTTIERVLEDMNIGDYEDMLDHDEDLNEYLCDMFIEQAYEQFVEQLKEGNGWNRTLHHEMRA